MIQMTLQRLVPLVGEWTGRGEGNYPTIERFDYTEIFQVQHDQDTSYLTYKQITELVTSDGRPIRKSHWEAGVIRPLEDGSVELACVQGSGRVEVLRGRFLEQESQPGELSLSFQSELIGNDRRMIGSSRDWHISGNRFEYEMRMATMKVGEQKQHLKASLTKNSAQEIKPSGE